MISLHFDSRPINLTSPAFVVKGEKYIQRSAIYRKRFIRTYDRGGNLNNEKWWKLYGLYTGMKFTHWRSGRWFFLQWSFANQRIFYSKEAV